jgi:molybdate transport system substrate-binding protein
VLASGVVQPGLDDAIAAFQRDTGRIVVVSYGPSPRLIQRLKNGERFDMVVATPGTFEAVGLGERAARDGLDVGRVGIGAVTRASTTGPDISTTSAFKNAVLGAREIVFTTGSSGTYFEGLLRKLDMYDQVEHRIRRYSSGPEVLEHVHEAADGVLGFAPLTELGRHMDARLRAVGPLPAEIQNYVLYRVLAITDDATTFANYLVGETAKRVFVAAGIE